MADLALFLFAFALGFLAAVPIGPVQIEMVKRAIAGHMRAAMAVIVGSVASDVVYGTLALFGVAAFLEEPWVLAAFSGAGALTLWALAYHTWRKARAPHELHLEASALTRRRWAFLTGFLLGSGNPSIILSWLLGLTLAKRLGLASPLTDAGRLWFVAGGALGLGGYLVALGTAVHRSRHFISTNAVGRVYAWLAVTLVVLSLFFVHGAARFFLLGV